MGEETRVVVSYVRPVQRLLQLLICTGILYRFIDGRLFVCVCVCVRERERKRKTEGRRGREREIYPCERRMFIRSTFQTTYVPCNEHAEGFVG